MLRDRSPLLAGLWLVLLVCACGGGGGSRPVGPGPQPNPDPGPVQQFDLRGRVRSPSGQALANTAVQLGAQTSVTGPDGSFAFDDLPEGGYTISLQSTAGDFDCRSIVLAAGQTQYDFTLPNPAPGFRVTRVEPRLGSSGAPLGGGIRLELSGVLDPASLSAEDFRITPEIAQFAVSIAPDGRGILLQPRLQLEPNQNLTVEVTGDIRSTAGEALSRPVRWTFRTAVTDTSPPQLLAVAPADGANDVALNQRLRFEFNETLGTEQLALSITCQPPRAVSAVPEGRFLTVQAAGGWLPNTAYEVSIANVADLAGNVNTQTHGLSFTSGTQQQISRNIQPDWNRVTGQIVFASDRGGSYNIWSIRPDGSELTQLTDSAAQDQRPTLSQDGRRLAFQRRASNNLWDIYVANLDGALLSEPQAVTPLEFNDFQPYFSRTLSNRIVFVSNRGQTTGLFTMNDDGSSPAELDPAFGLSSSEPAFHPLLDGQLLFSAFSGTERDIWRKSVSIIDGSTVNSNLTSGRLSDDHSPAWGPDASFFVFVSDFDGTPNLWQAEANGEFPRQVTSFTSAVSSPCVSPVAGDNACLLSLARGDGGSDLVIVSLTSGEIVRNLTSTDGSSP